MPQITFYDYRQSRAIRAEGYQFYALLAALFFQADDSNLEKLCKAFPGEWEILKQRYNAAGGILPDTDGFTVDDARELGIP